MLIGEISKKTGLSRDTIRFYEKKGLIAANRSDSIFNNYKNYTEENIRRLMLIKKAKSFGFTLNEIAELLELVSLNKATCSLFYTKTQEKISSIDRKIQELKDMKNLILKKTEEAKRSCLNLRKDENCKILQPRV